MRFKKPKFRPGDVWIILDEFIQIRTPSKTDPEQLEPAAQIPPGSFTAPPIVLDDPKNAAFIQSEIERAECLKLEYQAIADTIDAEIWSDNYTTPEYAITELRDEWERMPAHDRRKTNAAYVLETVNPDPDAPDHFDGDVIYRIK